MSSTPVPPLGEGQPPSPRCLHRTEDRQTRSPASETTHKMHETMRQNSVVRSHLQSTPIAPYLEGHAKIKDHIVFNLTTALSVTLARLCFSDLLDLGRIFRRHFLSFPTQPCGLAVILLK